MSLNQIVKEAQPRLIASIRQVIPDRDALGALFGELTAYVQQYEQPGYGLTIWYDYGYKAHDIDVTVAL